MSKIYKNFSAWLIDEKDFYNCSSITDKIKFLLRYAVLAPSAHNTQPWKFEIKNDIFVIFYIDKKKQLSRVSDGDGKQTYLSLGACLSAFLLAAEHFGFKTTVVYKINNGVEDDEKKEVAEVKVELTESVNQNKNFNNDGLFDIITTRRSAKLAYRQEKISIDFINKIKNLNKATGVEVYLSDNAEKIKQAGKLVLDGTKIAFASTDFRNELSQWIKNNWTKEFGGMPGNTVGMPGVISLIAPKLIKLLNIGKPQGLMMKKMVESSPLVGVITTDQDDPEFWMKAGDLFYRISLLATKNDLGSMAMGAPVEFMDLREKLRDIMSVQKGLPVLFFRIGKAKSHINFAPRWPLEEVIIN